MNVNNKDRTHDLMKLAEEMYEIVRDLPNAFTGGIALAYLEYTKLGKVKRPPGDIDIVTLRGYLPKVRKKLIEKYKENILIIEGERRNDESRIILEFPYGVGEVEVELFDTPDLKTVEVGNIRIVDPTQILFLKLYGHLCTKREKDLIDIYRLFSLSVVKPKDFVLAIKNLPIFCIDSPENVIKSFYEKIDNFPIFEYSEKEKIKETFDIIKTEWGQDQAINIF
jgi:hypothetical protein